MFAMLLVAVIAQAPPVPKELAGWKEGDFQEVYIGLYEADTWATNLVQAYYDKNEIRGTATMAPCYGQVLGAGQASVCLRFDISRKAMSYIRGRGIRKNWDMMRQCQAAAAARNPTFMVFRPAEVVLPDRLAKTLGHTNPPKPPAEPHRGQT